MRDKRKLCNIGSTHCLFAQMSSEFISHSILLAKVFCFVRSTSGQGMENALRACCKGIKIGKILIHREGDNGTQVCLCVSFSLNTFDSLEDDISFSQTKKLKKSLPCILTSLYMRSFQVISPSAMSCF